MPTYLVDLHKIESFGCFEVKNILKLFVATILAYYCYFSKRRNKDFLQNSYFKLDMFRALRSRGHEFKSQDHKYTNTRWNHLVDKNLLLTGSGCGSVAFDTRDPRFESNH